MQYEDYLKWLSEESFMTLEITFRCPLQCPLCTRQTKVGKRQTKLFRDMPLEDFEKILKFSKNINLCGDMSDPIYHPKFHDLVDMFNKRRKGRLLISTNGSYKSLEWWEKSFSFDYGGINWIFGQDGIDQETSNKYRVNTQFDKVFEVMKMGRLMGANIVWQFIEFPHNKHQIPEYYNLCKTYGFVPFLRPNRMKF